MKFAVISDIHLDINRDYPVLAHLAAYAGQQGADGFLIAGDISEHAEETIASMKQLEEESGCPVYYVPGNHDMWSEDFSRQTTDSIYQRYRQDPRCLIGKPQVLTGKGGPFALVGDIGWYDYSFGLEYFSAEELAKMNYDGRTWQDSLKNQWTADNIGRTAIQLKGLEQQLQQAGGMPVIVMTHMIPIREFCVSADRTLWRYFNAFLGSEALGSLFERCQAAYSISGHVHHRQQAVHGATRYLCACLGYWTEWPAFAAKIPGGTNDLDWQIENAVQWIEI